MLTPHPLRAGGSAEVHAAAPVAGQRDVAVAGRRAGHAAHQRHQQHAGRLCPSAAARLACFGGRMCCSRSCTDVLCCAKMVFAVCGVMVRGRGVCMSGDCRGNWWCSAPGMLEIMSDCRFALQHFGCIRHLRPGRWPKPAADSDTVMQGQKPLIMRLRLGYTPAGGAPVVEQTEIKNFPAGL